MCIRDRYNNIGEVYRSLGDFEKALFHHEKALEIRTRVVGQDHPDVGMSYYNLACAYAPRDHNLCLDMLLKAENTGFLHRILDHMQKDTDLQDVWDANWFKELVLRLASAKQAQ